jgi:hypothetical protein
MNKLLLISIISTSLLLGCQKNQVDKPIELSCNVNISTYDESNKWGKTNFYQWNDNLVLTISKSWVIDFKTAEKGWHITSNENMNYYPHSGNDPNQKGHPWWSVETSVDKNLIYAKDNRGNEFNPEWKNSNRKSLTINRVTGNIEEFWEFKSEDKSGYKTTYHYKLRGTCETAKQKF